MQYGLKAKPRRVAKFDALSTGTFIHYVLEHALNALGKCEGGAAHANQPAVRKACREAVGSMSRRNWAAWRTKPRVSSTCSADWCAPWSRSSTT